MERLTIDEAIAKEKEEAKRLRKIIETGYDGEISIEAIFCDDTDAIKEVYERFENCAKEHEQLAEWLEELKCYKNDNDFSDYADRLHKIAFNKGYNKALYDFVGRLIRYVDCGHLCSPTEVRWSDLSVVEMVKELAERLKAGGENDYLRR